MQIITAGQMRELDQYAMGVLGIPGAVLMENAGAAVAREAAALCRAEGRRRVHVLCGTGSNGGDGFVAARHLALAGFDVSFEVVGDEERISGNAATHLGLLRHLGLERRRPEAPGSVLVDALLGTGAKGKPRGEVCNAIKWINGAGARVVSADLPSGTDPDTGLVPGIAVCADVTVTFGFPKPGLLLQPGAERAGRLVVDPIGLDWSRLPCRSSARWYRSADACLAMPRRSSDAHKGSCGSVLVVGGSEGMTGAPTLAAAGALRSGAGLVTVAMPRCASPAPLPPEAMRSLLPDRDGFLVPEAIGPLGAALDRATAVCLGPGLGANEAAREFALTLMAGCAKPMVVDADALNALAGRPDAVRGRSAPTVLTPHPGECGRLLGVGAAEVQADRLEAARRVARAYRAAAILKGAGTVVSEPAAERVGDERTAVLNVGNPGMATGGSGDVLAGVVASLLAQGLQAFEAACLAAYVHGRAGDIARERHGMHGLIAGDIAACLPDAMKELTP